MGIISFFLTTFCILIIIIFIVVVFLVLKANNVISEKFKEYQDLSKGVVGNEKPPTKTKKKSKIPQTPKVDNFEDADFREVE